MSNKTAEEKIAQMEAARGFNHSQDQLKAWFHQDFLAPFPQRAIHVAGTNGKGSVITWLEVLLALKHQSTLSFTSPHLISHNERLRYKGIPIPLRDWMALYEEWEERFEAREMTMFEMDMWLACAALLKFRPDWVLMETGLGGTKDATTIFDYPYGIITQIGMDHMAYLGPTKQDIAQAKAGIIQEDMFVVTAESDPTCLEIFRTRAAQKHATLIEIDPTFDFTDLWPAHFPVYQKQNFLCAKTILELAGVSFSHQELKQAMDNFFWPARFEVLRSEPLLVLDGAHNKDGIQALVESIKQSGFSFDQIFFSVLADKQAQEMIETLQTITPNVTLVSFENHRLADLKALCEANHLPLISLEDLEKTLRFISKPTLVCGSLYFAGEVLKMNHGLANPKDV